MLQQSTCCTRAHHARGLCRRHYDLIREHTGKAVRPRSYTIKHGSLAERLWAGALADGTGCWVWQRGLNKQGGTGYGHIRSGEKRLLTHRVAYELVKGPIPDGLQIDHLCRNRRCINPDHLEAVTNQENCQRGVDARRNEKTAHEERS